jgi:hypothetical protein
LSVSWLGLQDYVDESSVSVNTVRVSGQRQAVCQVDMGGGGAAWEEIDTMLNTGYGLAKAE